MFDKAVKTQEKAITLVKQEGATDKLDEATERLESYRKRRGWPP